MAKNDSLAVKYRPKAFSEVTEQDAIKKILLQELQSGNLKRVLMFTGGAGTGKAQPLYSKILTPTGFVTMGEIKIGDTVLTDKGNLAKVSEIYPQGKRSIYEITIQDGTKIRVADNHLNCVYHYNQNKKCEEHFVYETKELIEKFKTQKFKLRVTTPSVQFKAQDVLIDPYLLGALLGDGTLTNSGIGFSNPEEDVVEKVDQLLRQYYGMYLKRKNDVKYDYSCCYLINPKHNGSKGDKGQHELVRNYNLLETLKGQLESYGLLCKSIDKHIPKQYLYNTKEIRLQLLQGLYDTDGEKGGRTYTTSSSQLAEDVTFLCRSLGIRVTVLQKPSFYNGKQCKDHYVLHLKPPKDMRIFTSKKHYNNYMVQQQEPLRNIVSIEYIGEEECQCIMVDHEDHTYISDGFIPTHNTTSARIFANTIESSASNIIEINCADHTGVDDVRSLVLDSSRVKPLQGKYKIFILDEVHMLTTQSQNALLKILEEPPAFCVYILCTTDPQKILGTILSRAFRYDFQLISHQGIVDRLNYVLQQEQLDPNGCGVQSWSMEALAYVATSAAGHMRNGLTTLDKVLSYTKDVTVEAVEKVLGVTNFNTLFDILDCILSKNDIILLQALDRLNKSGMDLKLFVKNFLQFTLDVNKYVILKTETKETTIQLTTIPPSYENRLMNYTVAHRQQLKTLLRCLMELNASLKWETNVKPVLETSLLLEVI